jgi:hypothetical protein
MLQVFHEQVWEVGAEEVGGPLGRSGPCVRARSEESVVAPMCICSSSHMCTAAVGRTAQQTQQQSIARASAAATSCGQA